MAPLVKEFQKYPERFDTKVCVTAQHREMLDQVLNLFDITPDYDLNIMKVGQDLYDVTSRVLLGMRDVLKAAKPDLVLVHGDTSTSTAAALAAFYQQIPVGHIEAGLRTRNIYSPWPEEMNRQITSRIATYNFAPTQLSKQNLILENISIDSIHVTGNTVIDALHWVLNKLANDLNLSETISKQITEFGIPIEKLVAWRQYNSITTKNSPEAVNSRKMILVTGHRRENFGQGFISICEAIKELAESYPEIDFVYPMHLNPNVRNAIAEVFGKFVINGELQHTDLSITNTFFVEPLDYLPFVFLMNLSYLVLTDSGGIQEEAPGLGKPVLVMRETTERPEALNAGTVMLVGTNKETIVKEVSRLINDTVHYKSMSLAINPYGEGNACSKIIDSIN